MATPIDYVDKQWEEWKEKNPVESFEHIDTELLKETLIKDLTYASQMDVREYTLYQKWCEVKERYPMNEPNALTDMLGEEPSMVNPEQRKLIEEVKKEFWMPTHPDEYQCLKPVLRLSNGDLAETWNAIRTFSSTMKNK